MGEDRRIISRFWYTTFERWFSSFRYYSYLDVGKEMRVYISKLVYGIREIWLEFGKCPDDILGRENQGMDHNMKNRLGLEFEIDIQKRISLVRNGFVSSFLSIPEPI